MNIIFKSIDKVLPEHKTSLGFYTTDLYQITINGYTVGYINVIKTAKDTLYISNFEILENYRHQNIGRTIIYELLKNHCQIIEADSLYESVGFWDSIGAKWVPGGCINIADAVKTTKDYYNIDENNDNFEESKWISLCEKIDDNKDCINAFQLFRKYLIEAIVETEIQNLLSSAVGEKNANKILCQMDEITEETCMQTIKTDLLHNIKSKTSQRWTTQDVRNAIGKELMARIDCSV